MTLPGPHGKSKKCKFVWPGPGTWAQGPLDGRRGTQGPWALPDGALGPAPWTSGSMGLLYGGAVAVIYPYFSGVVVLRCAVLCALVKMRSRLAANPPQVRMRFACDDVVGLLTYQGIMGHSTPI